MRLEIFMRRDDQQFLGPAFERAVNGRECRDQVVLGHGLFQVRHGAEGQAAPPVLVAGNDVNRDVAGHRIVLQAVEDRPPRHVRQRDIESNGAGLEFAGQAEGRSAAKRHQHLDAALVGQLDQDAGKSDVNLDDEQYRIARLDQVAVVIDFDIMHDRDRSGRGRRQNHVDHLIVNRLGGLDQRSRTAAVAVLLRPRRFRLRHRDHGDVGLRQIQGKRAAHAGRALQTEFAAEQPGQFAADGKAEPRPAVLAAGGAIRLLERFEDDLVFVLRDADAGIGDRKRDYRFHPVQNGMAGAPAGGGALDLQAHRTMFGELERVREQVLENLLEPLRVGNDGFGGEIVGDFDGEVEPLAVGHVAERAGAEVPHLGEADAADLDVHFAGFDLAEVENVVDQRQQVGSGGVNGFGIFDLLGGQRAFGVFRQHLRQDQQVVERRAQLVAHIGEELALVLGSERQLFGLFFERRLRLLDFLVLGFDLVLLLGQQLRLLLQLLVRFLKLFSQRLALLQQLLGPHRRADGVQHDADALRQLIEEGQVDFSEVTERGKLQDGPRLAFEQDREDDDTDRRRLAQARADFDVVLWNIGHQDAPFLQAALSDQPLSHAELRRDAAVGVRSVRGNQLEVLGPVAVFGDIEGAELRADERRQLREQQVRHGQQVALALHHAGELGDVGLQPVLIGVLAGGLGEVADHLVDGVFERRDFALRGHRDRPGQVALGHGSRHVRNRANLGGEVGGELVDVVGQVAPDARRARHQSLAAEFAFDADFARHVADLLGDFALGLEHQFAFQVAVGDVRHHLGDTAHLRGEVRGHEVHVIGKVFPGAGHAADFGLAAELAFGADFARHTGHFRGEAVELVHHRVDGVLQLENFALHVHRDLAAQVAVGHRGRHLGNVADLRRQVARHGVDRIGQVLPGSGDAPDLGLAAELAFGSDFAGDARHFRGERAKLIDHRIDGVLQLQNFAAHVHRNLAAQVALGHRGRHFRDVANLHGQVGGHGVDRVGQILPGAGHAFHVRLAAELAFGSDFARHARHFRSERAELIEHRVDGVLQLQNFAARVHRNLSGQVALRHRGRHARDVAHLVGQVAGHGVDRIGQVLPGSGDAAHVRLASKLAFGSDFARHARHFARKGVELIDHRVDRILQLQNFAAHVDRDLAAQVASGHSRGHFGDVSNLGRQVAGHRVDAVGQVLPHATDAFHRRLAAELAFCADLPSNTGHFAGKRVELVDHRVDGVFELENFAAHRHRNLAAEVAARHRRRHFRDVSNLGRQVAGHEVDAVGQIFPGSGDAAHIRLAAELAFGADFARHARHFRSERAELIDHRVDRVFQLQNFAARIDRNLAAEVAAGHGRGHTGDVTHLVGEVARHRVHRIGQVLPGSGHALHFGLAAQLAFGADFARHARYFRCKTVELVHHRVDGVLQLENFAPHIHRDLARQIAVGDRGRHFRDVADLGRQVAGHGVDRVGQVFPDTTNTFHLRLSAQFAFRTDLARNSGYFRGERVELVDHGVHGVLEFQDFALDVHRDLPGQVAVRHRRRHFRDVADLGRQVAGHGVDAVGQILPHAAHALHLRLTAELAFGTDFTRHASDLGREAIELVDHNVDGILQLQNFAARIDGNFGRKVALGHRGGDTGDVTHLVGQVAGHGVHAFGEIFPGSGNALHLGLAAQLAFGADLASHARHFRGERTQLIHHRVDRVLQFEDFAAHRHRDLARQVAVGDGRRDFRNVPDLGRQVAGHRVDRVGKILPGSSHTPHVRLAAQDAFRSHFARDARHLRCKCVQLVHHRIDGVLQLENFAAHVDGDFAGEVAVGDRGRHFRDVTDLRRQVAGHRIHAVREILPNARDTFHVGLAAQLAFGTDFARHARHFRRERPQLIHHRVDRVLQLENLALHIDRNLAGQVAVRHRGRHFRDVADLRRQVAGHRVDAVGEILPDAAHLLDDRLATQLAFGADFARHAGHLGGK